MRTPASEERDDELQADTSLLRRPNSLKPLDIEIMKRLGTRVNLIPIVSKADTLTPADLAQFKQKVSLRNGDDREQNQKLMILNPRGTDSRGHQGTRYPRVHASNRGRRRGVRRACQSLDCELAFAAFSSDRC